jgi:hypothetical protein
MFKFAICCVIYLVKECSASELYDKCCKLLYESSGEYYEDS